MLLRMRRSRPTVTVEESGLAGKMGIGGGHELQGVGGREGAGVVPAFQQPSRCRKRRSVYLVSAEEGIMTIIAVQRRKGGNQITENGMECGEGEGDDREARRKVGLVDSKYGKF